VRAKAVATGEALLMTTSLKEAGNEQITKI